MTRIAITGVGGYIGSLMAERFLDRGHSVRGIDRFFFTKELLGPEIQNHVRFELVRQDIRHLSPQHFNDCEVVIDLSGLSNDPSCDLRPQLTYEINCLGAEVVARAALDAGVKRYVYSSSCSVYGHGSSESLTEESPLNPVSSYAKAKIDVEQMLHRLFDGRLTYTILRNATVYGLSRRMRFDLVLNLMTLSAWRDRRIVVMGQGLQWRPLVHVKDLIDAVELALAAPPDLVGGQVFNVGSNEQNYQVRQLATIIKEVLPLTDIVIAPDDPDRRSYNVNFDKIRRVLSFDTKRTPRDGVLEILQALNYGLLDPSDSRFYTIQRYKFLSEVEKVMTDIAIDGRIF